MPRQKYAGALLFGALLCALAVPSLLLGGAARAQPGPNPAGVFGGFLGIMGQMSRQAQQQQQQQQLLQQQQQQYQQQQQQSQQQQLQQQQADIARQRAAAEAQERARQQRQAEAEAQARQKQIDAKAAADAKAKVEVREKQNRAAATKLRADPAFQAILGRDPRDVTVLVVGQDTANVVRGLKGEPVFQQGATVCLPFGSILANAGSVEARFLAHVTQRIEQKGGLSGSSVVYTACDPNHLADYDLILFSPGQMNDATVEILSPLLDLIRKRQFVPFATYTIADYQDEEAAQLAAAQAEAARRAAEKQAALASFQTRDDNIMSAMHITAPAPVVCVMRSPDAEGLRYLLKRTDSPFAAAITPTSAVREVPSADAMFIALKRQDCLAAVAPAGVLKAVIAGLVRDGVKAEIDGGEIAADRLAGWKKLAADEATAAQEKQAAAVAAQRRKEAEQATEEQQKQTLEEQRRKNEEASRREQLARMRSLVASRVNAVVEEFGRDLRRHMASVADEVSGTQQRAKLGQVLSYAQEAALRARYAEQRMNLPPWSDQFEDAVKKEWEFGDIRTSVEDYGRVQWKARAIEAIAVRVEFPMTNRRIGEKQVTCFDFMWINDDEFQFRRQVTATECDQYESGFTRWTQENEFVSQWNLPPVQ
jgi:hypothetical protein